MVNNMRNKLLSFSLIGLLFLATLTTFQPPQTGAKQIVDETKTLNPGQYWHVGINMEDGATVNIELTVESGPAVDFFVMDENNFDDLQAGNFQDVQYYASPSTEQTKEYSTEFTAEKNDNFYFVVDNTPLGGASATESADVHLMIEETGGILGLVIIGVIVMVVIGVVVWFFKFRGKGEEVKEEATKA